uniref:Uncharacterized protein LOC110209053 isoform X2 n=1 Tax=Phascolarctos cinereus TaxID=38626 RepID=A0A6P5KD02_PHACI|nr:uncharacterized protein LOC110209053 isoform X2 [Phascolarctos cinereus]
MWASQAGWPFANVSHDCEMRIRNTFGSNGYTTPQVLAHQGKQGSMKTSHPEEFTGILLTLGVPIISREIQSSHRTSYRLVLVILLKQNFVILEGGKRRQMGYRHNNVCARFSCSWWFDVSISGGVIPLCNAPPLLCQDVLYGCPMPKTQSIPGRTGADQAPKSALDAYLFSFFEPFPFPSAVYGTE